MLTGARTSSISGSGNSLYSSTLAWELESQLGKIRRVGVAVENAHIRIRYAHSYPCCLHGKAFFDITRNTHRLHNGTGMKINVNDTHSIHSFRMFRSLSYIWSDM